MGNLIIFTAAEPGKGSSWMLGIIHLCIPLMPCIFCKTITNKNIPAALTPPSQL